MPRIASLALPLASLIAVSACTSTQGDYPSLAVRDVERAQGSFEPTESRRLDVPAVAVDLEGGVEARLTALVSAARAAHETFLSLVPEARRRVGAAGSRSIASDAWGAAQISVAEMEAARSQVAIPLGDLDAIYISRAVQAEEADAIVSAREQVLGWIAEEDAVLEELGARLGN
ncbi:hypothetical protein E3U23_14085 [Erythrobacter litoralis]|uniref:hypothetical protein n=1 Tax=Erythrobacter litoralis TaxID=39960 RepID=UPI002435D60A|nr:hypothetical protein [Erythrobacter litoralis]MDG6080317.1 hypothetical protein [Erythrobacter litoralis]